MRFVLPPKVNLAVLPTRLERLERYSARRGREIWIKRDDLTEAGAGGNKIRKLEYLLRAAMDEGADTLVTCGGLQSNHARTTAILGRRLGLESVLVLRGNPADALEGNYLLDRLVGAEVAYVNAEEYERRDEVLARVSNDLRARGRKPYVIPEGGSNALGAMGYVEMIGELKAQTQALGLSFDSILCPVGSGGTFAGILMGIALYGFAVRAYGVNVQRDGEYFIQYVDAIFEKAATELGFPVRIPREEIRIIEGYVGLGYGLNTPKEMSLIAGLAREEGMLLDPVYTGKTFHALDNLIDEGKAPADLGETILFVHTGGIFGLFPQRSVLEEVLQEDQSRGSATA
ncbi:MAG: 1-aminocyclopropane-1-carboxylate deaminase/D-cysteine desulfhydrase [Nitrospinota bacterium]